MFFCSLQLGTGQHLCIDIGVAPMFILQRIAYLFMLWESDEYCENVHVINRL